MKNEYDKKNQSCNSVCTQTRKQLGKIMLGFILIIIALAWYIISQGIV